MYASVLASLTLSCSVLILALTKCSDSAYGDQLFEDGFKILHGAIMEWVDGLGALQGR